MWLFEQDINEPHAACLTSGCKENGEDKPGTCSELCFVWFLMQSIEGAIGGNAYQHNKVNQWTSNVVEQCLNQLTKLGKPFKYIGQYINMNMVTCGI